MTTNNDDGKKSNGLLLTIGVVTVIGGAFALLQTKKGKEFVDKSKKKVGELGDQISEKANDLGNAAVKKSASVLCSGIEAVQSGLTSFKGILDKKSEETKTK